MIVALLLIGLVLVGVWAVLRGRPIEDPFEMVGLEGVAQETFSSEGMVFVRGELWRATSERGLVVKGARVVVRKVEPGLLLVVEGVKDPGSK